jgi:hypothetical protein
VRDHVVTTELAALAERLEHERAAVRKLAEQVKRQRTALFEAAKAVDDAVMSVASAVSAAE